MNMQNLDDFLDTNIAKSKSENLLRELKIHDSKLINFASNDYLGLGDRQLAPIDFAKAPHIGSSGSRLTTGTHQEHIELEAYISKWKDSEAALVFGSGYLANSGAIPALMSPEDVIFADELNHACIMDGIRLSGAKKFFYKHNDVGHLKELLELHRSKYKKAMVITDTVFSMDGDKAKLTEIVFLKKFFEFFIYVDEAHGTGVLGSKGSGLVEELAEQKLIKKSDIEIQMGTFSKSVGVEGAYISGSQKLIDFLVNNAKTFMFSTAPSPLITSLILQNLKTLVENKSLRDKLKSNINYTRKLLEENASINWINEETAIFSIFVGDNLKTLETSQRLIDSGFLVLAIRVPTVPSPRLRVCINAKQSEREISDLIEILVRHCEPPEEA